MQQTELDRLLRKKLVYITRVYCNTLPRKVPFGVKVETAPEESGGRFKFKMSTRSEALVKTVTERLLEENITYTTRVEDRNVWFAKYFNNPNKSFTYRVAWMMVFAIMGLLTVAGVPMKLWAYLSDDGTGEEELAVESAALPVDDAVRIFDVTDQKLEIDKLDE